MGELGLIELGKLSAELGAGGATGPFDQTINPTSIASAIAIGAATLIGGTGPQSISLLTRGIPSAAGIGVLSIARIIPLSSFGIPSAIAIGTPSINGIRANGIASVEAIGSLVITGPISVTGIASAIAIGTLVVGGAQIIITLVPGSGGVATHAAVGSASINPPAQNIVLIGIRSKIRYGFPTVTGGAQGAKLYINGVDQTAYYMIETGSTTYNLQGQNTATLRMLSAVGSGARPQIGQSIKLTEFNRTIFSGVIQEVDESVDLGSTTTYIWDLQCVDWAAALHRRVVVQMYNSYTSYQIIEDIVLNWLTGEGITYNNVDGFEVIPGPIDFSGKFVDECFNAIQAATGEQWWIDKNKDLHFKAFGNSPVAPFVFGPSTATMNYRNLIVKRTTGNYRNQEFVRGSFNVIAGTRVESFVSQGTLASTFVVTKFGFIGPPSVEINGVAQNVYVNGVDPSGQNGWYYTPLGTGLQQGIYSIPAAGAIITVIYNSFQTNIVRLDDEAEQAARAAIEGNSGIYAAIDQLNNTTMDPSSVAQGYLARSGTIPVELDFETDRWGLEVGQSMTVNLPQHGLVNTAFVITQVQSEIRAVDLGYGSVMRNKVTAMSTQDQGDAYKWYGRLVERTSLPPPATQHEDATFNLGIGGSIVGGVSTNYYIAKKDGIAFEALAIAVTPPVGQNLVIDITLLPQGDPTNAVSIFGALTTKIVIPDGFGGLVTVTSFDPSVLQIKYKDVLKASATYVATAGSTTAAENVTVVLRWTFT